MADWRDDPLYKNPQVEARLSAQEQAERSHMAAAQARGAVIIAGQILGEISTRIGQAQSLPVTPTLGWKGGGSEYSLSDGMKTVTVSLTANAQGVVIIAGTDRVDLDFDHDVGGLVDRAKPGELANLEDLIGRLATKVFKPQRTNRTP